MTHLLSCTPQCVGIKKCCSHTHSRNQIAPSRPEPSSYCPAGSPWRSWHVVVPAPWWPLHEDQWPEIRVLRTLNNFLYSYSIIIVIILCTHGSCDSWLITHVHTHIRTHTYTHTHKPTSLLSFSLSALRLLSSFLLVFSELGVFLLMEASFIFRTWEMRKHGTWNKANIFALGQMWHVIRKISPRLNTWS